MSFTSKILDVLKLESTKEMAKGCNPLPFFCIFVIYSIRRLWQAEY